ncbi:MAG: hypothetical protein R3C59_29165 [Planctomycetaceae bacterium]
MRSLMPAARMVSEASICLQQIVNQYNIYSSRSELTAQTRNSRRNAAQVVAATA